MSAKAYSLSFIGSGLRQQDSLKLARLYKQYGDWEAVRTHVIEQNTLQQRTMRSTSRIYLELVSRLKALSEDELEYLVECAESEVPIMLWVALCRRYAFMRDFAADVLREHRLNLKISLDQTEFDVFFNAQMSEHEELSTISLATKQKARQILFLTLREVRLVTSYGELNQIVPNAATLRVISPHELDAIGFVTRV